MESAVSFAPLRPADFVNFAGRGGASIPVENVNMTFLKKN